ncbi:Pyridoxal-dependent decarboxylase conserved domain [Nesidiocoris tenuis]|uniref:Pyridoxal-dependent decarboxylase conserved domain n=1 Tax=Nesidiocoris tenuis TaxID=355587 RepID=A0ABN7B9G5_9HEMI|nr:Pyridoxal-dependent decarboxylase conserved domain [Nesidiocoris tenuis]
MDAEEFRKHAKMAIDYIIDYNENIRNRQVLPSVEPGYLHKLIPSTAPAAPEDWSVIIPDIERFIQPGLTHWNSPNFNGFFPAGNSYPSIFGEILSAGLGCVGFNWMLSPACTELEVIVLDWLAKLMGLPEHFLAEAPGPGGGIIQGSGSEGILVALLTAKERTVRQIKPLHPNIDEGTVKAKLVAYFSDQSNSAVEKACLLGSVRIRPIKSNPNGTLKACQLKNAIVEDRENGLIPCFVVATLGTTATCAFDDLTQIGSICEAEGVWLHVDAAYAGAAFVCPEYRYLMAGLEYADSLNMNPHKWLLVNFDCSCFWVKDRAHLLNAFTVDRDYLRDHYSEIMRQNWAPNFRNWEIPLGRRFRALKLWITLRMFGESNLRNFIRKQVSMAKRFESKIQADSRFELCAPVCLGLVCFRIVGEEFLTRELLSVVLDSRELFLNGATLHGKYFLRYAICSRDMDLSDVDKGWTIISNATEAVFSRHANKSQQVIADMTNANVNTLKAGISR